MRFWTALQMCAYSDRTMVRRRSWPIEEYVFTADTCVGRRIYKHCVDDNLVPHDEKYRPTQDDFFAVDWKEREV